MARLEAAAARDLADREARLLEQLDAALHDGGPRDSGQGRRELLAEEADQVRMADRGGVGERIEIEWRAEMRVDVLQRALDGPA